MEQKDIDVEVEKEIEVEQKASIKDRLERAERKGLKNALSELGFESLEAAKATLEKVASADATIKDLTAKLGVFETEKKTTAHKEKVSTVFAELGGNTERVDKAIKLADINLDDDVEVIKTKLGEILKEIPEFAKAKVEEAKKENGLMDALNKGFKSFGKDPKTPVDMESELMKALKGKGLK